MPRHEAQPMQKRTLSGMPETLLGYLSSGFDYFGDYTKPHVRTLAYVLEHGMWNEAHEMKDPEAYKESYLDHKEAIFEHANARHPGCKPYAFFVFELEPPDETAYWNQPGIR